MSKRLEVHQVSLGITIKQVFIRTKLEGKLTFEIRGDNQITNIRNKLYQLENQHCAVYQHVMLPLQAEFDSLTQTYKPLQITIFVNLDDEQGNSVGGYVRFNPFEQKNKEREWKLPLQSLFPNSTLQFSSRIELISKKQSAISKQFFNTDTPLSCIKSKINDVEYRKSSVINYLTQNEPKNHVKEAYNIHSDKYTTKEKAFTKNRKAEEPKINNQKTGKDITKVSSPRQADMNRSSKFNDEMQNLKKKIEEQRAQKVRSISKLKMELNPRILAGEPCDTDEEKGKLKEKIRNLQRKQKNYQINIDDLNRQIQSLKSKVEQISKTKDQYQRSLGEKEIRLKTANQTIKTLNQQIESLNSKEKVVSKKGEVKETMLKNEAKKMEQKIRAAEAQANNAIKEKNELIKSMAELQKKHQAALREKDVRFNDEKIKFSKQKQQWLMASKQLEFTIKGLEQRITLQEKQVTSKVERISQLQIIVIKQENEAAEMKQTLKEQRERQENIYKENGYSLQSEYTSLKKIKNEIESQKHVLEQKFKRLIAQRQNLQNRIKQLDESLKNKNSENQKHLLRINALQKENEAQKEEGNRKAKELEHLRQTISSLNSKITNLKEKADLEKSRREECNVDYEKQLWYFNKQKQALEGEIYDLKWAIDREKDKQKEHKQKETQLNDQILKLSEQVMTKTHRITTLEQKYKMYELQNENLIKQKQVNSLKLKELIELNKMKQYQLDQQKKNKLKAEQRYEEQKERANQLQAMNKAREIQQQKRQKEREAQVKELLKQNEAIEAETFKKNQEIMTLKASNELINRQMQMIKSEFETVQSQLNVTRSENSQLKEQIEGLTSKNQQLTNQIVNLSQKLTIQGKKIKIMKQQQEEYKASMRLSFENLVKEFFKEQNNSNIVATTLKPFPDETLSSLQIQLVQLRNNFLIKHRQKMADLEMQVGRLQRQVNELKVFYQNREGEFKNDESKERQKLKTLVYQTMVQKNNVIQELNLRMVQKEELFREYQKLRGQIIRREDNENELNGQLQMLLLQYDSLKSENQDLNNLIYKYREEEIKNQGETEQKLLMLNEQYSKSLQRLRSENIEKQKKIIDLQRQKMEIGEKEKRKEVEKNKYKEQYEKSVEKVKEQDHTIIKLSAESTKLNNTLKQHEMREMRYKETIQNNEARIVEYKQSIEMLQKEIDLLQQEINNGLVANQKLKSDNLNLTEKLEEINKVLYEKGEISKQKIEKKIEENAQLKTRIIQKESELSLRQFSLKQKEQQNLHLLQQNNELKLVVESLRTKVKEISELKDSYEMKIRQAKRQYEELQEEKRKVEEMLAKSNFNVYNLETHLQNLHQVQQQLKEKEKECIQLRIAKAKNEQKFDHELRVYKQNLADCRKEMHNQKNHQKIMTEQHKESLQYVEKNNTVKYNELLFAFQKQREEFEKRVQEIETHNTKIVTELQRRLDKANELVEQARYTQKVIHEELTKKDAALSQMKKRLEAIQNSNEELKQKYNKFYLLYQECKAQKEQILKENQEKVASTINQTKNTMQKSFRNKLAEINRQIHKLKHNEEINLQGEPQSKKQFLSTLQRIFSKVEHVIQDRQSKEGSDSFEVKKHYSNTTM